jgi:hypothetical protein
MKLLYRSIIIVVKKKSQENRQASTYWFKVDHYLSSEKLYFIILQKKGDSHLMGVRHLNQGPYQRSLFTYRRSTATSAKEMVLL